VMARTPRKRKLRFMTHLEWFCIGWPHNAANIDDAIAHGVAVATQLFYDSELRSGMPVMSTDVDVSKTSAIKVREIGDR
jgi:hypothetical protein